MYWVECLKNLDEFKRLSIHTYVIYTYLMLKYLGFNLEEFSKPEALKQAWKEKLKLPILEGFEEYHEEWHRKLLAVLRGLHA
jgi:hypothetical protein